MGFSTESRIKDLQISQCDLSIKITSLNEDPSFRRNMLAMEPYEFEE